MVSQQCRQESFDLCHNSAPIRPIEGLLQTLELQTLELQTLELQTLELQTLELQTLELQTSKS